MNSALIKWIFAATFAIGIAVPQTANASSFTMNEAAFLAANPGLTLIDFEGLCLGGTCAVPAFAGVTFSGTNLVIADGPTFGAPSDWLADNAFGGFIDMAFSPAISAVGFRVSADFSGNIAGQMTVNLFNGVTLLDTQTFGTTGLSVFDTFVGWSGLAGLDNLRVTVTNAGDFVNVDNVSFGESGPAAVPEPASLTLLGLGVAALGRRRWAARRKA
jgi:hypothetical protein